MNREVDMNEFEVGYDIPAAIGMDESEIQTPCLMIDLDAFEHNIEVMRAYIEKHGIRHRLHGKMHKSVDVANYQIEKGNACGVCCQKVSEAEVFARAGIKDVLVSNQVRDPAKIDRLARLPKLGARTICCIDDIDNVKDLSEAAVRHGTEIEVLVEIDCGAGRCGVSAGQPVVDIAKAVDAAEGLKFAGIQAYQGAMQHMPSYQDRKEKIDIAIDMVKESMDMLKAEGLECDIVGGGGTGSYYFEGSSGVYNELQCGSYAFMDADYQTINDENDQPISEFKNALFILTSVMSHAKTDKAICDAGLKAQSIDSGLPYIYGRDDVKYIKCSDEHGVIEDEGSALKINEKLKLVPGHCDPTCNVHDWYVGVRNGKVESLWPISARGKAY
jgi:3-hydroxy-D-aspartate aldolase